MVEPIVEFAFSMIDYTYLLYFYLLLIHQKWEWKKACITIAFISLLQFTKDSVFSFGRLSIYIDIILVVSFLFLYCKPYTLRKLLYAFMIYSIFCFIVAFFITFMIQLFFDANDIFGFGFKRVLFFIGLKLVTIFIIQKIVVFLENIPNVLEDKVIHNLIMIFVFTLLGLCFLYGNCIENKDIFIYTLFLTIVIILVYVLFYRYCKLAKKTSDIKVLENMMTTTFQHVQRIEKEQQQTRQIRHDMKNQMTIIAELLRDRRYQELSHMITSYSEGFNEKTQEITGNIIIDAVLSQKMTQYADVEFKLNCAVTTNFTFDHIALVSLLSNIIDNACEEVYRINEATFYLQIYANETQLKIIEKNKTRKENCLKTDKDKQYHGYGLKILNEIVNKYEGDIQIVINEYFIVNILIIL